MEITWGNKEYRVYNKPSPHIVIDALEHPGMTIPGRWNLKSDSPPKSCTQDVLHLAPYKGCSIGCTFCSLPLYRGYGFLRQKYGVSVVFDNYWSYVDREISKTHFMHTCDFGADADAFMDVNRRYHLTEKTMGVLNKWGVPFSVTTKGVITDWAIEELTKNKRNWAQISVISLKEEVRKVLVPGKESATVDDIEVMARRIAQEGIPLTARVQPYIPWISDPIKELIPKLADMGFNNVVFGLLRAPMGKGRRLLDTYSVMSGKDFSSLFTENYPGYRQVSDISARRIVENARDLCVKNGLKFGLCDMYVRKDDGYASLQEEYGTVKACECVNAYGYIRLPGEDRFQKVVKCPGNCLYCDEVDPPCGVPEFAKSAKYTIKNYQKIEVKQ